MTHERTLTEAEKQALAPGIVFVTGPAGRRARIADAGPDVWELILTYHQCGDRPEIVREVFPHLSGQQLEAALRYYRLFPAEVDEWIDRNTWWPPEDFERLNARRGVSGRSQTAAATADVPDHAAR